MAYQLTTFGRQEAEFAYNASIGKEVLLNFLPLVVSERYILLHMYRGGVLKGACLG